MKMPMKKLSLCISPCPNDTFAFDALLNGRIDAGEFADVEVQYLDIEELNRGVLSDRPDISKISYSVYPLIERDYCLLDCGSALGRGNGQLLVRRRGDVSPLRRVATPGIHTTAHALLCRYFPQVEECVPMLFSDIAAAVACGEVDAGVLIHEGRFVYQRLGLELVADLGQLWERETSLPLPLGAIVMRRDLPEVTRRNFERLLRSSIEFAMRNPTLSRDYVKSHAQELDDDVIESHIALFVNEFTLSLGKEGRTAVECLTGCRLNR